MFEPVRRSVYTYKVLRKGAKNFMNNLAKNDRLVSGWYNKTIMNGDSICRDGQLRIRIDQITAS